jgi:hypothetical protein
MMICDTKKIKLWPLVSIFNGGARKHVHTNPLGRGSQGP